MDSRLIQQLQVSLMFKEICIAEIYKHCFDHDRMLKLPWSWQKLLKILICSEIFSSIPHKAPTFL